LPVHCFGTISTHRCLIALLTSLAALAAKLGSSK
jgi:hypothetical protein